MSCEPAPPFEALSRLSWRTLVVTLQNIRAERAVEHPLAVFQGLLRFAAAAASGPLPDFFFHPLGGPLPTRMRRGRYRLEVVFPDGPPDELHRFVDALSRYMILGGRNFRLIDIEPPRLRNLDAVAADFPDIRPGLGELCLDFQTPFPFTPADKSRRCVIGRDAFFGGLARRVETLFGIELGDIESSFAGVTLLPYYWDYVQHQSHMAKSHPGEVWLHGTLGPLYLKGDLDPVLPLLLVCSELHATQRKSALGQGYYRPVANQPFFDTALRDPDFFTWNLEKLDRESDLADDIERAFGRDGDFAATLHNDIASGAYAPDAVRCVPIPKKDGTKRPIHVLSPRDAFVHKALHRLLSPVVDRMLENASVGFRPGRSRDTARRMIAAAIREGCVHVLEADIASFFDAVDRDSLFRRLDAVLPSADRLTRNLLAQCIAAPTAAQGEERPTCRGLLQGSPLSPLLANLYLDTFDEDMVRLGHRLIRYADDFVVLCKTREDAEQAHADANALLAGLGLSLSPEKTRLRQVDMGFSFLGFDFDADNEEEFLERAALRKPLFIAGQSSFVGLDGDALTVRRDGEQTARVPLERVSEVVVFGGGGVSTRLLNKCSGLRVPVSFCSPGGWYTGTLRPDSRRYFEIAALHAKRREAMDASEVVEAAKDIVGAKIAGYAAWFRRRYEEGAAGGIAALEEILAGLAQARTVDAVRGFEGAAARATYGLVTSFVRVAGFAVSGREPRKKLDRFNALIDFASYFLFTRLNVLLRSKGLNPYLGFLHSPEDRYESLVCDLQEPFRCRMERMAVRLVNRGEVRPEDYEYAPGTGYRFTRQAAGKLLERFEREMATRLADDPGTWGELVMAQTKVVLDWAQGYRGLAFYSP